MLISDVDSREQGGGEITITWSASFHAARQHLNFESKAIIVCFNYHPKNELHALLKSESNKK